MDNTKYENKMQYQKGEPCPHKRCICYEDKPCPKCGRYKAGLLEKIQPNQGVASFGKPLPKN